MRRFFLFALFCLQILHLFSIEISNEETWYYYSNYQEGNSIFEDKLYLNCLTGIEVYDILSDGSLELSYTKFFNNPIFNFKIYENGLIYINFHNTQKSESIPAVYEIVGNNIIEKYTPQVNGNIGSPYIHLLGDKALYRHNYNWLYVDAINESCQFITDIYGLIIGVFDNKIVDYVFLNDDTFEIRFWKYDDIAEPELLYSYNSSNVSGYDFVYKLDNNHLLINREFNLSVLDISDENNYHFVSEYNLGFSSIIDVQLIENSIIYLVNDVGINCCIDYSDIYNPVILNQWQDEYQSCTDFSIYNEQFLFKSKNGKGFSTCDISELNYIEPENIIENSPFANSHYDEGYVYYTKDNIIYKVDVETSEIEELCETPIDVGFFHKYQNLMVHYGPSETDSYLMIISLDDNSVLNYQIENRKINLCYENKIFIQETDNIFVYQFDEFGILSQIATIELSGFNGFEFIAEFDEENFYVSHQGGEKLINKETFEINHDFGNFFSGDPDFHTRFTTYNNRLIVHNYTFSNNLNLYRLYDISDYDNPILLDYYNNEDFYWFYKHNDKIIGLDTQGNLNFYYLFVDSFTTPFYQTDINACSGKIEIEEENNRLIFSSWYYTKTYYFNGETDINIEEIQSISHNLTNYPNPFSINSNSRGYATNIQLELVEAGKTELAIYNIKGQKVKSILNAYVSSGKYSFKWDGKDNNGKIVASGNYVVKLKQNGNVSIKKMMVMK